MPRAKFDDPKVKITRFNCFKRDGFKCVICGKGKDLEHHHIVRVADAPNLEFVVSNTVTLCREHHESVTGREDFFAEQFRKIVKENEIKQSTSQGHKPTKKAFFKPYYKVRDPRKRY